MRGEHAWEKLLGEDPFTRTVNLARAARDYRELTAATSSASTAAAAGVDRSVIAVHARQLQLFGQNLESIKWRPPPKPKPKKVEEILSRRYTDDFEFTLELEWNTQQWGAAEIEAACDVLVNETEKADATPAGVLRRKHCLQMIEKLLQRHRQLTGTYMVKNIEVFVHKALANVRLKESKFQNLVHLICLLARHFPEHLNALNIVSRLLKLLMAEVELAIQIIQHAYRQHIEKRRAAVSGYSAGQQLAGNIRTNELREQWNKIKKPQKRRLYCIDGPSHLQPEVLESALKAIRTLCSGEVAQDFCRVNREDVARGGGLVLCRLLMSPNGRSGFAKHAGRLVREVAREQSLIVPILEAGLVSAFTVSMEHHIGELRHVPGKADSQIALLLALETLVDLGTWASKRLNFDSLAPDGVSVKRMHLLPLDTALATFVRRETMLRTVSDLIVTYTRVKFIFPAMNILWCFLSATPTYDIALDGIVSVGGRCAQRLVQLLESSVRYISQTAMRVLQQVCLREEGRAALISCEIAEPLCAIAATEMPWKSPSAMFATLCLHALTPSGTHAVQRLPDGTRQLPLITQQESFEELYTNLYTTFRASTGDSDGPLRSYAQECSHVSAHLSFITRSVDSVLAVVCHYPRAEFTSTHDGKRASKYLFMGAIVIGGLARCRHFRPRLLHQQVVEYLSRVLDEAFAYIDEFRAAPSSFKSSFIKLILEGIKAAAVALRDLARLKATPHTNNERDNLASQRAGVRPADESLEEPTEAARSSVLTTCVESRSISACAYLAGLLPAVRVEQFPAELRPLARSAGFACTKLLQALTPTLIANRELSFKTELRQHEQAVVTRMNARATDQTNALIHDALPFLTAVLKEASSEPRVARDITTACATIDAIAGCILKLTSLPDFARAFVESANGVELLVAYLPQRSSLALAELQRSSEQPELQWDNLSTDARRMLSTPASLLTLFKNILVVPGVAHECMNRGVPTRILDFVAMAAHDFRATGSIAASALTAAALEALTPYAYMHFASGAVGALILSQAPMLIAAIAMMIVAPETSAQSVSGMLGFLVAVTDDVVHGAVAFAQPQLLEALLSIIDPQRHGHAHEPVTRRCISALCNFCKAIAYSGQLAHSKAMTDTLLWHAVQMSVGVITPRSEICEIARDALFHLTKPRDAPPRQSQHLQQRVHDAPCQETEASTSTHEQPHSSHNALPATKQEDAHYPTATQEPSEPPRSPNEPFAVDVDLLPELSITRPPARSTKPRKLTQPMQPIQPIQLMQPMQFAQQTQGLLTSPVRKRIPTNLEAMYLDPVFNSAEEAYLPHTVMRHTDFEADPRVVRVSPAHAGAAHTLVHHTLTGGHLVEVRKPRRSGQTRRSHHSTASI